MPARSAINLRATAWLLLAAMAGSACSDMPDPQRLVFLASGVTDQILVLDQASGELVDSLDLDVRRGDIDEPHDLALSPDGRTLYATLAHGNPSLLAFDVATLSRLWRLELDSRGAARIGITPDGARSWIPDYHLSGQGAVSGYTIVNLRDGTVATRGEVCPAPHHALPDPSGQLVALACTLSDEVVILNALDPNVVTRIPLESGSMPMNLAWTAGGASILVATHHAGILSLGRDGVAGATVATPGSPGHIAVSPDSTLAAVALRDAGGLMLLRIPSLQEDTTITLGAAHPLGVAWSTDSTLYVSFEGTTGGLGGAVRVDLHPARVTWRRDAGVLTQGITVTRPGQE